MLNADQIAVLLSLGKGSTTFEEEKKHEVVNLLVRGYIERDGVLFRLTPLGRQSLQDALLKTP